MSTNNIEDSELRKQLENVILIWSSEITGEPREQLAPDAITLVDRFEQLITQRELKARLDGRRIQAQASLEKWNFYMDENIGSEFDTFLKGQIESHEYELAQLNQKEE